MADPKNDQPPRIVLETSVAIAYLANEPECGDVEKLLAVAEAGLIRIRMSDLAWQEIDTTRHGADRIERLRNVAMPLPKVARLGEWQLGVDVLAHDASLEIEDSFSRTASREDREQLLSYAAQSERSYFVTKDRKDFLRNRMAGLYGEHGFNVGQPKDCIAWLRQLGI